MRSSGEQGKSRSLDAGAKQRAWNLPHFPLKVERSPKRAGACPRQTKWLNFYGTAVPLFNFTTRMSELLIEPSAVTSSRKFAVPGPPFTGAPD